MYLRIYIEYIEKSSYTQNIQYCLVILEFTFVPHYSYMNIEVIL